MTEYTNKPHKKGMEALSWILVIGLFIGMSMLIINWVQSYGKTMSEETVKYVESKMACESIRIANTSTKCAANSVNITNLGTLNIVKVSAQLDDKKSKTISIDLKAQGTPQTLNIQEPFKKLKIIPITKSDNDLVGCKQNSLTIYCP